MERRIIIRSDNKDIHATLKDTKSAEKFATLFPFHTSGYDSGIDYCCAADTGHNLEEDVQTGWKNGDVGFGGDWFSILYAGEEQSSAYTDMVIIAHVDEADLKLVKQLPQNVDFVVDYE